MSSCGRCGRKLKNPKYIEMGFGKVCYGKHLAETARAKAKEAEVDEVKRSQGKDRA